MAIVTTVRGLFTRPSLASLLHQYAVHHLHPQEAPVTMANPIPTFEDVRACLAPVWQKEDNKRCVLWAGVFGSVGRERVHTASDVDIVLVMTENTTGEPVDLEEDLKMTCARNVSYLPIWHGPKVDSWMWGHVRIEALLSGRTVYGDRRDIDHLKREGLDVLARAIVTYDTIAGVVAKIKACSNQVKTLEGFTHPDSEPIRHECLAALQTLLDLLEFPSPYDPIRTMVVYTAFVEADTMRERLTHLAGNFSSLASGNVPSSETGDEPSLCSSNLAIWDQIWHCLQPDHTAMWSWDVGCASTRKYINHMLASARLSDVFEEGRVVDKSLYADIVR